MSKVSEITVVNRAIGLVHHYDLCKWRHRKYRHKVTRGGDEQLRMSYMSPFRASGWNLGQLKICSFHLSDNQYNESYELKITTNPILGRSNFLSRHSDSCLARNPSPPWSFIDA